MRASALVIPCFSVFLACGGDPKTDAADEVAEKVEAEVEAEAAEAVAAETPRGKREKKDRGDGSMNFGDVAWTANSASARPRRGKMNIKLANTDTSGPTVKRQELHLQLDDFDGPGDYVTGMVGSRFISVGIDTEAAKEAETKDAAGGTGEASTRLAVDAIQAAGHVMLGGAKVHVETADETTVTGTFSWTPPPKSDAKPISDGKFRALIRQKKK